MAKKAKRKSNATPAKKRSLKPLVLIARSFAFVGKPLYFLLSQLIIGLLFIPYIVGHITRITPSKISIKLLLLKLNLLAIRLKGLFKFRLSTKLVFLLLAITSLLSFFYFSIFKDLPSPRNLVDRQIEVSTKIYDRNGNLLYKIYKDKNRTIIPLSKVPPHVRLATLAAEDAEFYTHPGFSVRGISRAFFQNLKTGKLQGGSTITQQLVKNALLTSEKTLVRKLREVILSVQVELTFSKDQILEMYLNEVSYGGTVYGIEEASYSYFGRDVGKLNLAEAAFLAGLPQSPTHFSPYGATPDLSFVRQREVLHLMKINRFITSEQEEEALNQRITLSPNRTEIKAPHFVMYIRQLLVDKYGEEVVAKGGLEVTTTLDLSIQELAERVVKEEVEKLKNLNVGNGAAVVINPQTGEILAMVGSKDYFDIKNDGNVNVTIRPRQPGSSIKVVNYAYALSHGFNPATILDDSPVSFAVPGQPIYSPKNYDGKFKGRISLRVALAESRNIPAVKVLASYGVNKMIEMGRIMGITTWEDPSRFGLSLTLGGGEVKLIELAQVYSTIANYGKRPDILGVSQVKNFKGEVLGKNSFSSKEVVDSRIAYMLIDILKDNVARSGEFGTSSYLVIKNHPEVAVKTGTSNDLRDNLTAGFNQDYLVVTWVGNNNNTPMARIASGVTGASPIWNKIMSAILNDKPSIDWKIPEKLVKVNICMLTGTLPCNGCPTRQEWFLEESQPTLHCSPEAPYIKENKEEQKLPQIL